MRVCSTYVPRSIAYHVAFCEHPISRAQMLPVRGGFRRNAERQNATCRQFIHRIWVNTHRSKVCYQAFSALALLL